MKHRNWRTFHRLFFSALAGASAVCAAELRPGGIVCVLLDEEERTSPGATIAIERLREYSSANVRVLSDSEATEARESVDLRIVLSSRPGPRMASAPLDSYRVQTLSPEPLTVLAAGTNRRGMLYAAYRLADLLKAKADLSDLDLFYQPKVGKRYVSFGATTHGRRYYRPALYWKTLHELPRFGYNGVLIYPGGGTPIGRFASPIVESKDGTLSLEEENTNKWRQWLARIDAYSLETMMTVPPIVPPGYERQQIRNYYAGGPQPKAYLSELKAHFRRFLELLTESLPNVDMYMFNSTEGATFGAHERFFGHPAPDLFSHQDYLKNNEDVMTAYFDVLTDFFGAGLNKVCFWTHSYGITSEGIVKMREVLFRYPQVTVLEDDFWNNNLWPFDLPVMNYVPEGLRSKAPEVNPFALFQIGTDGEYYGGGSLPNAYPDSRVRSANEALARGARMVIQRMDLHARTPYGTAFGTMEIIPYAASKQLWSPTPSIEDIWQEWAERRFGKMAAPHVVQALQQSGTVVIKGLSCNGVDLLAVGQDFTPRLWKRDGSGLTRFYLFGKPDEPLLKKEKGEVIYSPEYTIYQMDTHSIAIEGFRKNQDEAAQAIEKGLDWIETARPHLADADYKMLREVFLNGRHVLTAMRLLGETAYATNIVLSNFDNVERPEDLFEKSVTELEAYLDQDTLIPEMEKNIREILAHYKSVAASSPQSP